MDLHPVVIRLPKAEEAVPLYKTSFIKLITEVLKPKIYSIS